MSDRPFFSTRYTYPGVIFFLFFGLICRTEIIQAITAYSDTSKLIYGFVFTLSGAPIGFLISQFWYSFIINGPHFREGYGWLHPYRPYETILFLEQKFNINIKNTETSIAALNYLYLLQKKTKQKTKCEEIEMEYELIRSYIQRRVDILNTLGTSILSIIFGLLLGLITHSMTGDATIVDLLLNNIYIISLSFFIIYLMFRGITRITSEQRKMIILLMNQTKVEDLKNALPEFYFNKDTKDSKSSTSMNQDEFYIWMVEQYHVSYLTWVAIWLASGIGMVEILFNNTYEEFAFIPFLGLNFGMVFCVWRLVNIVKDQIITTKKISKVEFKNYLFEMRGKFSTFFVNKEGMINYVERNIIIIVHFGIGMFLWYIIKMR